MVLSINLLVLVVAALMITHNVPEAPIKAHLIAELTQLFHACHDIALAVFSRLLV